MNQLTTLRDQLHHAMVERDTAQSALDTVQSEYDAAFKQWQQENATLVERHEQAQKQAHAKTATFERIRTEACLLIEEDFYENYELPEGFAQTRNKKIIYDKQGFLKIARNDFPFLLTIDEEAAEDFFFSHAKDVDGSLQLPEYIRRWASVMLLYEPCADIDDEAIAKLDIASESDEYSSVSELFTPQPPPEQGERDTSDSIEEDEMSQPDFAPDTLEERVPAGVPLQPALEDINF